MFLNLTFFPACLCDGAGLYPIHITNTALWVDPDPWLQDEIFLIYIHVLNKDLGNLSWKQMCSFEMEFRRQRNWLKILANLFRSNTCMQAHTRRPTYNPTKQLSLLISKRSEFLVHCNKKREDGMPWLSSTTQDWKRVCNAIHQIQIIYIPVGLCLFYRCCKHPLYYCFGNKNH